MNGVISKLLFPTASRAVIIRNIFTKEYLGLAFLQGKQKETRAKEGKNAVKIKNNFLKSYKQTGNRYDIWKFMSFVEGEKDMDNLSRVVKDFLADARW